MKNSQRVETILKKNRVGGPTPLNFKTYYKAPVFKTLCFWHEVRHRDHWNKIESPDINHTTGFIKGANTIQWGKNRPFNKWCWEIWISTCKTMKLNPYHIHIKINSGLPWWRSG